MGSKGSQTTQTTNQNQSYSADPRISQSAGTALDMAGSAASQPFQMPVAPIAGFSPLQQQAFNQYQSLQGTAQPYYNQAQSLYSQSAAPITGSDVSQYYNPMADSVTAQLQNIFGQQNSQNTSNLVKAAGGVGADRIAVGQGNMANQQTLAAGQVYSNLYQNALQAAQQQKQMAAGAASGLTGLGTTNLQAQLAGTNALSGAGAQQQQQSQAELNAPYQNQLARLAYPFQTAQYLAGITGGLAPALGGTTTGYGNQVTTPPTPSALNQIAGIGTAGAGLYGAFGGFGNVGSMPATGAGSPTDAQSNAYAVSQGIWPYAEGGGVDDEEESKEGLPYKEGFSSVVPTIPMHAGAGHSGPLTGALNMSMPAPQQQQQSNGFTDVLKTAASIVPFFLKQGGSIPFMDANGDVPIGKKLPKGYDDGGFVNDPSGPNFDVSRPIEGVPTPWQGMWPFNRGHTEMGGHGEIVPNAPPAASFGERFGASRPQGVDSNVEPNPHPVQPGKVPLPTPYPGPGAPGSYPNAIRMDPPGTVTAEPEVADKTPTYTPPANRDAPPREIYSQMAPRASLPYPDSLQRDWGQNATRSPWMALVQAGATMAATPGPLGSAIGKGLLAGTKSLDDQRKELRSEEELNNKAKDLYEKAREHLDKFNKMTPYERASVAARNRELDQSETGVSGKPGKFTGADYDRAAKFVQSMNPGLGPDQLQPLIDAEVARRRRYLAAGTAAAGATNVGSGDAPTNALPDPGEGRRVPGKWYIGPSGQPQQWVGH